MSCLFCFDATVWGLMFLCEKCSISRCCKSAAYTNHIYHMQVEWF